MGAKLPLWVSEYLLFSWIVLRGVILHPFLEIWAKVKSFLRLSHIYSLAMNPKIEMDVKPKIETDFDAKIEYIDDFNKGMPHGDNWQYEYPCQIWNAE